MISKFSTVNPAAAVKFRLYEVLMFVLLISVCLALISPIYRYYKSVSGNKNRVVKHLDHEAIREAGQALIAKNIADEELDLENELPDAIAATKPTLVSIRDEKLYLEYGNSSATFGLIVVQPKAEIEMLAKIIDGVYFYESRISQRN